MEKLFYIFILAVISLMCFSQDDPCFETNHRNISDWKRSVSYTNSLYICDSFMEPGWYRPTSLAGDRMPTYCLENGYRCGTVYPLWMNGTYPAVGEINNVTACAAGHLYGCCFKDYDIQVKNCGGFFIYNLVRTYGCQQGYCFGTEIPCPTGMTSENGFTPGCTNKTIESENNTECKSELCEEQVEAICLSSPCINGATCYQVDGVAACNCTEGYEGVFCENIEDMCLSSPCINGATCYHVDGEAACNCTEGYVGVFCETNCRPGPADIVIVLDTSSSIHSYVNKSIEFVTSFVRKVPIGPHDFQIAVISYNFQPNILFDLDDYTSASDIIAVLQSIRGENAPTMTSSALQNASEVLRRSSYGARNGVNGYIMLLYDGLSSDSKDTVGVASSLNKWLSILTVSIGGSINHLEMLKITGRPYYTYSPLHMEDIYSQIKAETTDYDCSDCALENETQIIILLDTNKNQTAANYNARLSATRQTIEKLLEYNSNTQIGMFSYSDEPEQIFPFSSIDDKNKMITSALILNRDEETFISNTSHVLKHVYNSNPYTSVRKILVLISDGLWIDMDEVTIQASLLETIGIKVVGVIAGEDCDIDSYNLVINDPSKIFYVQYFDFTALDSLAAMTSFYHCSGNIF